MQLVHRGKRPHVHPSAYVAPNAVVCGDVTIGAHSRVLFGAVVTAEGGPVEIGEQCIVMEHAVVRGSAHHPARLGDHVLVGPHAHLTGCTIADDVFIATGAAIFNGARIGTRSVVRINAVVHIRTVLPADTVVPIGWVAIGDPPEMLPPDQHERISAIMRQLDFPRTVFGLPAVPAGQTNLPEITRRYAKGLGLHREDRVLDARRSASRKRGK